MNVWESLGKKRMSEVTYGDARALLRHLDEAAMPKSVRCRIGFHRWRNCDCEPFASGMPHFVSCFRQACRCGAERRRG